MHNRQKPFCSIKKKGMSGDHGVTAVVNVVICERYGGGVLAPFLFIVSFPHIDIGSVYSESYDTTTPI